MNKKTVRLIALGPSCAEASWQEEGKETWGIQYTWRHFKLDRAFVMDDKEWIEAKNNSFNVPIDIAGEMRKTNIPIYVAKKWQDVANTIEYPIGRVLEYFKPVKYFMNSVAYMLALAILEGYERIEMYGIDLRYFNDLGGKMEYHHNWIDETHCIAFWAGQAIGRGIELVITKRSSLMKPVMPNDPSLYGYEVSPMILSQRKGILDQREKVVLKQEPEKLMFFRPNAGESREDFTRRVETGNAEPIAHAEAKVWEDITDVGKNTELEIQNTKMDAGSDVEGIRR